MRKAVNPKVTNVINDLISEKLWFDVSNTEKINVTSIYVKNVKIDHFEGGNFAGCLADPVQTVRGVLIEIPTYETEKEA